MGKLEMRAAQVEEYSGPVFWKERRLLSRSGGWDMSRQKAVGPLLHTSGKQDSLPMIWEPAGMMAGERDLVASTRGKPEGGDDMMQNPVSASATKGWLT